MRVTGDTATAKPLVTVDRGTVIESWLPKRPPRPPGGRPVVADRAARTGILFVLKTGLPGEYRPPKRGTGGGMTGGRRRRGRPRAGAWRPWPRVLRDDRRGADHIDWSRAPTHLDVSAEQIGSAIRTLREVCRTA